MAEWVANQRLIARSVEVGAELELRKGMWSRQGASSPLLLKASELNVSSWDGYLIGLARELGIPRIYSVGEELTNKVKDVKVVNPIPENVMKEYHKFVKERLGRSNP